MIFHSFSSSLSIRDELVESSSDSCNILPETVTGSAERARMRAGEPKKNVVNPGPKEPPKPPVVQK
jgi:hypothetical protein